MNSQNEPLRQKVVALNCSLLTVGETFRCPIRDVVQSWC